MSISGWFWLKLFELSLQTLSPNPKTILQHFTECSPRASCFLLKRYLSLGTRGFKWCFFVIAKATEWPWALQLSQESVSLLYIQLNCMFIHSTYTKVDRICQGSSEISILAYGPFSSLGALTRLFKEDSLLVIINKVNYRHLGFFSFGQITVYSKC